MDEPISLNLLQEDILLMRSRYDEALQMMGIPCEYQYPMYPDLNSQGEAIVDNYSVAEKTHIFFDGSPKIQTYKRLGWVVENQNDLPFLIHCSFNLQHLQKDCIFRISGQYSGMPDRVFRVTELTYDLQCADHIVCKVVPVIGNNILGKTRTEVKQTYDSSNHFLRNPHDYRGNAYKPIEDSDTIGR